MVATAVLTDGEREGIHELERGAEWVRRAHGALGEFHGAIGHAMDHYRAAEEYLPEQYPGLAECVEQGVLPTGPTEEGHPSYQLVAEFEAGVPATVEDVTGQTSESLVDSEGYVIEDARHGGRGKS